VFQNHSYCAIQCEGRFSSLRVTDCYIDSCHECGISIYNCKNSLIEKSIITHCNSGIIVEEKGVIKVTSCSIKHCGDGIVFGFGKIKAEVSDCILMNISYAVYITGLCVGTISFYDNVIANYDGTGIANCSDARCCVTLNGDVFPTNTVQSENDKLAHYSRLISMSDNNANQFLGLQRSLKAAGILEHAPPCNKCNVKEPKDEKFLKCGRCKGIVYCSKECQKNDWPVHKTVCTPSM
jgi:hypothetical protein